MDRGTANFLLALVICFSALPAPLALAAHEREVTVSGSCTRTAVTDRGAITLTADFVDPSLDTAVRKATQAYDRANDGIRRLGLEDFDARTVEYSVSEDREWQKDKSVFKGYHVRIGLKVTTSSISKLGRVIEIASREDIHDVSQLTMSLSDERLRHEEDLCLKEAGEHARAKARELAASVGASLGPVVSLSETAAAPLPRPPRPGPLMRVEGAPAGPAIQSGQQEVAVSVQATFALR